jgi:hypothetical protein
MLPPAGCIPGPAGLRPNPSGSRGGTAVDGVQTTPAIRILSAGQSPDNPNKAPAWFPIRKKDLATFRPSALKYPMQAGDLAKPPVPAPLSEPNAQYDAD